MKKTLLKTVMLSAIASLAMSGSVLAHHPSEDNNPNFDVVDANISDMHNTVIDAMMEDSDLMASTNQGMDGGPSMAAGDGANANETSTESGGQVDVAPGNSAGNASQVGGR